MPDRFFFLFFFHNVYQLTFMIPFSISRTSFFCNRPCFFLKEFNFHIINIPKKAKNKLNMISIRVHAFIFFENERHLD